MALLLKKLLIGIEYKSVVQCVYMYVFRGHDYVPLNILGLERD